MQVKVYQMVVDGTFEIRHIEKKAYIHKLKDLRKVCELKVKEDYEIEITLFMYETKLKKDEEIVDESKWELYFI